MGIDMNDSQNSKLLVITVQIILCLLFAIIIVGLVQQYVFAPVLIEGASMMPTIKAKGDKVYILKTKYKLNYYDIVVLYRPNNLEVDESKNPANQKISFTKFINSLPIIGRKTTTTDDNSSNDFTCIVKRIIGMPGDTISIENGQLFRKPHGTSQTIKIEDFIMNPDEGLGFGIKDMEPTVIGEDELFVLGDNRNSSYDSEDYGPVKISWVYGKVLFLSSEGKIKRA